MKNAISMISVSAIALTVASSAACADPGKSREQVQAELAAAQKAGDVIGPSGFSPHKLFPSQYPTVATGQGKTREQVEAELAAAQKAGDVIGPSGFSPRELFPGEYPAIQAPRSMAHTGTPYPAN
jgi:hypothetical protein